MNMKEATGILAVLSAAYPSAYKNMTHEEVKGVITVWAIQFANLPADIVFMALNKAISTCKFPPSIAEIKEAVKDIHWEAHAALSPFDLCEVRELSFAEKAEYERIYNATCCYENSRSDLDLNIIKTAKKYLIGDKEMK